MTALALVADYGTATIWRRVPDVSPAVIFGCAVSLGAENYHAYVETRAGRIGTSGVWAQYRANGEVSLEAFAPDNDALSKVLLDYLERCPHAEYRTRFSTSSIVAGEHIALGWRYSERVTW